MLHGLVTFSLALALWPLHVAASPAAADETAPATGPSDTGGDASGDAARTSTSARDVDSFLLEPITVSAEKRRELVQNVPGSVTVLGGATAEDAGIDDVQQASYLVPNVFLSEFTAAKLSFPFVRGVGGGSLNPAVTTYIDGVPQLNVNSSSIVLVDVDRIEFLRGPQSTLYGRNTLGGAISILTREPSWQTAATAAATWGNHGLQDYRGTASGTLAEGLAAANVSFGYLTRNGYTENEVTGNDLDGRADLFGRGGLLLTPGDRWKIVARVWGERDDDGDYALGDLGSLRAHAFRVSRNVEGYTRRDLVGSSVIATRTGESVDFTSITGFVWWETDDFTDLDYLPVDFLARGNAERQTQFTQELRVASAEERPLALGDDLSLRWLGGLFVFTQDYDQDARNEYRLAAAGAGASAPFDEKTIAHLDDVGVGVFGQATLTAWRTVDATVGLRWDDEHDSAELRSFTAPPVVSPVFGPPTTVDQSAHFDRWSPRFALAWRATPSLMAYASVMRGYKAGGFNPTSPPDAIAYGSEGTWSYEVGVKSAWLDDRVTLNGAGFWIDWSDLQLDVPNPLIPGRFYVANAGDATSRGVELELRAQPLPWWGVFGAIAYTDATFDSGSMALGQDVGGNRLPYAPQTTWNVGTQVVRDLGSGLTLYGRAELYGYGRLFYDATNAESQGRFEIADFRLGLAGGRPLPFEWRADLWVRNAFGEDYIPLAFPFPLAASGYVGEMGAPRTFGVTLAVGL